MRCSLGSSKQPAQDGSAGAVFTEQAGEERTVEPLEGVDAENVEADEPHDGDGNGQPHPDAVLAEAVPLQCRLPDGHAGVVLVGRIPAICGELVQHNRILHAGQGPLSMRPQQLHGSISLQARTPERIAAAS